MYVMFESKETERNHLVTRVFVCVYVQIFFFSAGVILPCYESTQNVKRHEPPQKKETILKIFFFKIFFFQKFFFQKFFSKNFFSKNFFFKNFFSKNFFFKIFFVGGVVFCLALLLGSNCVLK